MTLLIFVGWLGVLAFWPELRLQEPRPRKIPRSPEKVPSHAPARGGGNAPGLSRSNEDILPESEREWVVVQLLLPTLPSLNSSPPQLRVAAEDLNSVGINEVGGADSVLRHSDLFFRPVLCRAAPPARRREVEDARQQCSIAHWGAEVQNLAARLRRSCPQCGRERGLRVLR